MSGWFASADMSISKVPVIGRLGRPLLVLFALMQLQAAASAAPRRISPLPQADCHALAKEMGNAIGLPLVTATAHPEKDVFIADLRGNACLISGSGKGVRRSLADVSMAVRKRFAGWKEELDLQADGPDGTISGYRKGDRFVIYSLQVETPPECDKIIVGDCTAAPTRWTWTVKIAAFRSTDE